MPYRQTPEMKRMHGNREAGRVKRTRNKNKADRASRYDKRSVKARELLRCMFEEVA